MPQKRFWNWKADDLTVDLDRWLCGIIEKGVLRGFDFQATADMNLKLVHTVTGTQFYFADKTQSPMTGVLVSPMGVIIQDDTEISLPVSPGDATNPRIDLVVCSSEYTYEDGGEDAVYQIIPGTPAVNPVAPSIFDSGTDVVIGRIYIPAGTTVLTGPGVVYTRTESIPFANQNYAHRNQLNRFTSQQQWAPGGTVISFNSTTSSLYLERDSNSYLIPNTVTLLRSVTFNGSFPPAGTQIRLTAQSDLTLQHNVGGSYYVNNQVDGENIKLKVGSWILIESTGSAWLLIDYSLKEVFNRNNVYKAAQQSSQSKGCRIISKNYTVSSIVYSRFILELDPTSNYYLLDLDDSSQMGTYNPLTDLISLHVSEPTNFKQINGINAYIKIISTNPTKRLAFTVNIGNINPPVGPGTGFIAISNLLDIYNQSDTILGPSINLTREDTFYIKGVNDQFVLESLTAVAKNAGSRIYQDTSNVLLDGDSHSDALKKILAVTGNSTYTDPNGILINGDTHRSSLLLLSEKIKTSVFDLYSSIHTKYSNGGFSGWVPITLTEVGSTNTTASGIRFQMIKIGGYRYISGSLYSVTFTGSVGNDHTTLDITAGIPTIDLPASGTDTNDPLGNGVLFEQDQSNYRSVPIGVYVNFSGQLRFYIHHFPPSVLNSKILFGNFSAFYRAKD